MEPRVLKREKKIHLSYELPHRIHCADIYPLTAPNGSTIILYGYDRGLRILWRGGRRPRDPSSIQSNGKAIDLGRRHDAIEVDADADADADGEYESEEDEQDADCPFPSIIQDVSIDMGTATLKMATPSFSAFAASDIPPFARTHVIVALASSNAEVLLLTLPLLPPSLEALQSFINDQVVAMQLHGDSTIAHGLAVKVVQPEVDESLSARSRVGIAADDGNGSLLIAAVATGLNIWNCKLMSNSVANLEHESLPILHSSMTGNIVSFRNSPGSGELLLAGAGTVRVYDTLAARSGSRHISHEVVPISNFSQKFHGRWTMSLNSPFRAGGGNPTLERRKKILDATWLLGGRGILVLLEDGEWGIWDLSGSTQSGKSLEEFAIQGLLEVTSNSEHVVPAKQKTTNSKLAPMTPNTRKAKAENLFSGAPKHPGLAPTGGISILSGSDRAGKLEDSVIMWYNGEFYSIPSVQTFLQRSSNSNGGLGSLYAPGLAHVSGVDLMNENVTSVSQFASKYTTTNLGRMSTPKDLLISAEHRLVILQSLAPTVPSKQLFQQEITERSNKGDQRMLDVGHLDVNEVARVLDDMAEGGRVRRVGFAR